VPLWPYLFWSVTFLAPLLSPRQWHLRSPPFSPPRFAARQVGIAAMLIMPLYSLSRCTNTLRALASSFCTGGDQGHRCNCCRSHPAARCGWAPPRRCQVAHVLDADLAEQVGTHHLLSVRHPHAHLEGAVARVDELAHMCEYQRSKVSPITLGKLTFTGAPDLHTLRR
jgi:hypothetical protein